MSTRRKFRGAPMAIAEFQTEEVPYDYSQFFVVAKYKGDRVIARYDELCEAAQWIELRGRWRHLYRVLGVRRDGMGLDVVYEADRADDDYSEGRGA